MRLAFYSPAALVLVVLSIAGCGDPTTPPTPPSITTTTLADGTVGERYAESVTVSEGGGQAEWEVVGGMLPPGLGLSVDDLGGDDLTITGIPTAEGSYSFELRVRVPEAGSDSATFSIEINAAAIAINTGALAPALIGHDYLVKLEASVAGGGQASWTIIEGALPDGVSFSETGQFNGSPSSTDTAELVIRASAGGVAVEKAFTLVVHEEDTEGFNITILPAVPIPAQLRDNVAEAVRRWESAIIGDLTRFDVPEGGFTVDPDEFCAFASNADGTSIDDMIIIINIGPIDEGGSKKPTEGGDSIFTNTIGSGSPCFVRIADGSPIRGDSLPIVGVLTLDEFDLFDLEENSQELATDLIQHEIAHVLGLGSMWQFRQLLTGAQTNDPRYVGDQGIAAYQAAGGQDDAVPVENLGPAGSRNGHWRESVFKDELMTASLKRSSFLSAVSIASYADLGYEVDTSAAEGELNLGTSAFQLQQDEVELWIHGDFGHSAIHGIRPDGSRAFTVRPLHRLPR